MVDTDRENWIQVIEAQPAIDGRFTNIHRIDARAGDGNFSLVFKAFDEETRQEAALKFYNPLCVGDGYRGRCFERESRILERLRGQPDIIQLVHPRSELVLPFTDTGTGLSVPVRLSFLAMELAYSNVMHYIYSEKVTSLRTLLYFRAMCRAVQRLHANKICHRDIKPENFLMVGKDVVHLGDFGTARVLDGSMPPLLDEYYGWRGDRRYTAPEQCVAMDEKPDLFFVGDMYSLGAILFEMFTKQPLFPFVFDTSFHHALAQHFRLIPVDRREGMFRQLVPDISRSRQLPNIYDFDTPVPDCIRVRLDRLYKGLAYLDHERRTSDFAEVFRQLNMCSIILEKETVYRRFIEFRRKCQAARQERKQRFGDPSNN